MNLIIEPTLHTLQKSKSLLSLLTNEQLSNESVSPYYSCIGSHIRHILDLYDCVLRGINLGQIDLSNRSRDVKMHEDCNYAKENVIRVMTEIKNLRNIDFNSIIKVEDDLGLGMVEIEYTIGAVFAQANSHAIHHYAILSYILDRLEVSIEDKTFGYNPTTPRPEIKLG